MSANPKEVSPKFVLFLCAAIALVAALPAVANDTAMFRGNPAHSGIYDATGFLNSREQNGRSTPRPDLHIARRR